MKIGMIGISGTPSMAKFSHNAGWTRVIKSIAEKEFCGEVEIIKHGIAIHDYDTIIINEGLNYKEGSWNFFGGVQPDTIHKLVELGKYHGDIYSYNERIDWSGLKKRKEINNNIVDNLKEVKLMDTKYSSGNLIIGDSHTVSIYQQGNAIIRKDGATLYGALKPGGLLENIDHLGHITIYLGNIDVRFHIHRNGGLGAVKALCMDYLNYIQQLTNKGLNVTIQGLIPIEDESRKIPGTGTYKGENFYGSREERQTYVNFFNSIMRENAPARSYNFREWDLPIEGFEAEGKFFCMEARQSVHLRPEYYNKFK